MFAKWIEEKKKTNHVIRSSYQKYSIHQVENGWMVLYRQTKQNETKKNYNKSRKKNPLPSFVFCFLFLLHLF